MQATNYSIKIEIQGSDGAFFYAHKKTSNHRHQKRWGDWRLDLTETLRHFADRVIR